MPTKKLPVKFFFLNGELHRKLQINRADDKILTWNYPQGKRMYYVYSQIRKEAEQAFTLKQAGELLHRTRVSLEYAIMRGDVPRPQMTYSLTTERRDFKYMLSEEDVIEFHKYFKTQHKGRPRKDGAITTSNLPSERELRAKMRQETIFYVKTKDGKFVPTFEAEF